MKVLRSVSILYIWLACFSADAGIAVKSDTSTIRQHLVALTKTAGFRHYKDLPALNAAAEYIKLEFTKYSSRVTEQEYQVQGNTYKNIVCSFGPENAPRIIVGAHYDVCGPQPGADDNATGVVGLLELARLIQNKELPYRLDLVAYTLEEPPFFRTDWMGSYIHAKSLHEQNVPVKGMLSLEMIGYFDDEKGSQDYPLAPLKLIYGNKGNYITVVKKFGAGKYARQFTRSFKKSNAIRTKVFSGPAAVPGVDFSDHLNYWRFGYSALMLTDTSFYRNKNYHEPTDTLETLDLPRMARVIDGVLYALINLS